MKFLLAVSLLFSSALQAQTGEVAVQTVKKAESNHWQTWTFVACTLVIAAGAVLIVSMDNGKEAPSN